MNTGKKLLGIGCFAVLMVCGSRNLETRQQKVAAQALIDNEVEKDNIVEVVEPVEQELEAEELVAFTLPYDQLFITPTRQAYEAETMQLKIPVLEIDEPVYDKTDEDTLKNGPCLYEYAQLPSEEGANVSIASHRIKKRGGFLDIDQLKEGDLLYLIYENTIYKYIYDTTQMVEENDWSVVYRKEGPCVTLTSCEPALNPTHRIVVTAKLLETLPYDTEYVFEY